MSALLLSIDLEDVRDWVEDGRRYQPRVPVNTERYLEFFQELEVKATFFTVGSTARQYPDLIRTIAKEGHELACHSDRHIQITRQTPEEFFEDIVNNKKSLEDISGMQVSGYRAPTFSLIARTAWAHDLLARAGFAYSSSVLPANNPLFGWPEFGRKIRKLSSGLWELPMTLHSIPFLQSPIAGGVYFRVFPYWLTSLGVRTCQRNQIPLTTYFHPYDIDFDQERFMHPDLNKSRIMNTLMYVGRAQVLGRLRKLHKICDFMPFGNYVETVLNK